MLREAGKRCGQAYLRGFLSAHGRAMPRTMLRYSIERLPAAERKAWLEKTR
jgi:3-methyladenine DNA glycosylase AlkD